MEEKVCWNCGIGLSQREIDAEMKHYHLAGVAPTEKDIKYFMCFDCHQDQKRCQEWCAEFEEN